MSSTSIKKPHVLLIPWDPTSPKHVERLVQQRIACGWDHEAVESWRATQESGEFNLQWIVLDSSDVETNARLLKHAETFPQEKEPLLDSALSFGGKPRSVPSPQRSFVPVGHVSLGPVSQQNLKAGYVKNEEGMYWIGVFYVSRALQGSRLGSAAMDTVENIAISPPLNAKVLGLNAINKVEPGREEKYKALGLTIPPFSNQEWYERRGYQVFNNVEKLFAKVDSTDKTWTWDAVFLKKYI
ncbi:uncharacterized protein LY89DRAFT_720181 [Mollisia scopiformis]|uniref:Uncharacterized protein n=1 Tax=Mollisia scopiformis TaxID=149040 RepID=A0A194X3T2_MOLSC|nr:uncharacterized protein LY89DRAFT_720181 [Mollisia scopiformis]KUJ14699.1 hypothetical protein LY89DRAFT_720181 [Mollisia scopiformis]